MSGRAATDEIIAGDYAMSVGLADMPTLPGWHWVCLTDIARLETGHTPSRKHPEYWDGDIPWVGIRDANANHGGIIEDTFQHVTELGLENSAARLLPANTVCLSRTASVGYVVILGRPMATSQDFVCWVCSDAIIPQFLMYLLLAEADSLPRFGRGSTHTTIYFPEVKAFHICLPPVAEQRRIVGRLELLLGKVSSSQQRLSRVPGLLKRFRQSVLAAACSGKLTADWREENEDVEPVSDLIQRIFVARKQRYDDVARQFISEGKKPPKRRANQSRQSIDSAGLPEIPQSWEWVTWDDLADWITYGFTRPMPHVAEGIPVVTAKNVRDGFLDYTELDRTTPEAFAELSEKDKPRKGEILITKDGAIRGRAALVETDEAMCISQSVAVVRFGGLTAHPPYLLRVIQSRFTQNLIEAESSGTAIPHISITDFGRFPVPLPPLAEQQEIVRRVEKLFAFADQIEARLKQAQAHVDRLTQSLLAKAFRGELVPTEHTLATAAGRDYEPASELLRRITQEQEHRSTRKRGSRHSTGEARELR